MYRVVAAVPGAGMAGMLGAVVANLQLAWFQRGKRGAEQFDSTHGKTFLKGLTLTLAYTPAEM